MFEWFMSLLPDFHGDYRVLLGYVYLAAGAFVMLHGSGVTKYYTRQTRSARQHEIVFTSLIICVLLWPIILGRKDVHLKSPKSR